MYFMARLLLPDVLPSQRSGVAAGCPEDVSDLCRTGEPWPIGNDATFRPLPAMLSPARCRMVTTINRVQRNTDEAINRRIEAATGERIRRLARHPLAIERRLRELEREWDIERVLETNAALIALVGVALGARLDRRWLMLPALVTTFLFQHAVQGWCPPIPLLRRLGIRP